MVFLDRCALPFAAAIAIASPACASQSQLSPASDAGSPAPDVGVDVQADAEPDVQVPTAQRVIVLADDDTTFKAELYAFERSDGAWSQILHHPVTIGRNGLGWGVARRAFETRGLESAMKARWRGPCPPWPGPVQDRRMRGDIRAFSSSGPW